MSNMLMSATKPTAHFSLDDIDHLISPRPVKKETAKSTSTPSTHDVTTRAKAQSVNKRKLPEPDDGFHEVERQLQDAVAQEITQGAQGFCSYYGSIIKDLEETLSGMGTFAATKDKLIAKLTKEKKHTDTQVLDKEAKMKDGIRAATYEAKKSAAKLILHARIQFVAEANDPSFDNAT